MARYFARRGDAGERRPIGVAALLLIAATLAVLALWGYEVLRAWDEPVGEPPAGGGG